MPRKVWMMEGPTTWQFGGSSQPKWSKNNILVQHHKSTVSHSVSHSQMAPSTASCSQATCNFIQMLLLQKGEKSFPSRLSFLPKNRIMICGTSEVRESVEKGQVDFCFKTSSIEVAPKLNPPSPFDFFNHLEIIGAKLLPAIYALHLHVLPTKGLFV